MKEKDITYFEREKNEKNPIFFERFPQINYEGLKVLDLGCAHGAISIDLAVKGANEIVGVDLEPGRLDFAQENLKTNYPEFLHKISFKCVDFRTIKDNDFDLIISKASFEHFIDLETLLNDMKNKLKVGGKIISGFGPLYNSPWGDHNRLKHSLPWTHVLLPEKYLIKRLNRQRNNKAANIQDLGLNGYSLKKYRQIFYNTDGLAVIDFRTNVSERSIMKVFNLFSSLPFLREYFTFNIYCVLERVK